MLSGDDGASLQPGSKKMLKLAVTFRATDRFRGKLISNLLFDIFEEKSFQSVVMFRADRGYDQRGFTTASVLGLSIKLPVILEAVEESEKIMATLPMIKKIVGSNGLIETSGVDVYSY